jgi:hypothetical protein
MISNRDCLSDKKEGKPIDKPIVAAIQVGEIKSTRRTFFQKLHKPPVIGRRLKRDLHLDSAEPFLFVCLSNHTSNARRLT